MGDTDGHIVADPETYGANKLWCVLKPIPIELDDDDSENETVGETISGTAATMSAPGGAGASTDEA